MPYDSARLVRVVARRLELAGESQPVEPNDEVIIREGIPDIVEDLHARGVFSFADLEAIEPAAFPHLAAIVAARLADELSTDDALATRLEARAQDAERKLRIIAALPYAGETAAAVYY